MKRFFGMFAPQKDDNLQKKNSDTTSMKDEEMSPFVTCQRDHAWPSLYTEVDEMLESSVLVYALAELRSLARQGKLTVQSERALALPITHSELLKVVQGNQHELADSKFGKEFYIDLLQTISDRNMMAGSPLEHSEGKVQNATAATIVAFDDETEKEELVYMIEVDHVRERVTVCFRGSVTPLDWATNLEMYMKEIPNRMKANASQVPTVRVHNGFHDYLFEPSNRGAKGPNGEDLSEYQEILQEHVLPVIHKHHDYKVYVTGHSLGGALATLFAFELACEPEATVPKPVTLINFACPYVGDSSFRLAHQMLESQGRLRHLRVTNHKDLITTFPKVAFRWNVFDRRAHVGSLFKHVGINLRIFEGSKTFKLCYPKVTDGFFSGAWDGATRGWSQAIFSNIIWNPLNYWTLHTLREYNKRMEVNNSGLHALFLNDVYAQPDIVGNLVPQK